MKIRDIYIGGWFQRTMLQLTEIYDFIRFGESELKLDKRKLKTLRENLQIKTIDYGTEGLEYISFETMHGIIVKIYEDGLIVLNDHNTSEEVLFDDIKALEDYYEKKLSPAINYIFSLGAPVPKELAGIQTVYPYFIVTDKAKKEEIQHLLDGVDKQKYFEFSDDRVDILRGDKYYFLNSKKEGALNFERYIEEQIFIREFKGQLHRYLNLHRIIWEKIDVVKERAKIKGKDILKFNNKLDGYAKTITLIDGRIAQMGTYIGTREKLAKANPDIVEFLGIMGYRYETLKDTLSYIQRLWSMTNNYVNQAKSLFRSLQGEVTEKSLSSLTIVTSMGVGASLLGYFDATSWPSITPFGIGYFLTLAAIGIIVNFVMKQVKEHRSYIIDDIEYDKNIK